MFSKNKSAIIGTLIVGTYSINAAMAHDENDAFASAMSDKDNWEEVTVQRPIPPIFWPDNMRNKINNRFAAAMNDSANWETHTVCPPMVSPKIEQIKQMQDSKTR